MLLHGRLDVLWRDGERGARRRLQVERPRRRRAGRDRRRGVPRCSGSCTRSPAFATARSEVEVAYQFLERPDDVVSATFTRADTPALEAELSAAIARIRAGDFRPTPSEFACADCPALDLVCAGPRSRLAAVASRRARRGALATSTATCPRSRRCWPTSSARTSTRSLVAGDTVSAALARRGLRSPRSCRSGAASSRERRSSRRDPRRRQRASALWSAERLGSSGSRRGGSGRSTLELEIAGLGSRALCHSTPPADEPIYTRDHAGRRARRAARAGRPPTSLVCGHTHMQYDRMLVERSPRRESRAASGCRTRDGAERSGRSSARTSSSGARDYDVEAAVAAIERLGAPGARGAAVELPARPASTSDEATAVLRVACVARSYVHEARRRGLGRRRERIGPIVERLAEEHADAEIALRFRTDLELLVSVMLSAQTTDVNVNRVTPALFAKYRTPEDYLAVPARGARARHLRDRLLPAEGEGDPRHDAHAARGVRRRGADAARRSSSGCRASRARPRTSSPPSSGTRRASSSTRTCGGSRSGSG